jgi:hypothetical protein
MAGKGASEAAMKDGKGAGAKNLAHGETHGEARGEAGGRQGEGTEENQNVRAKCSIGSDIKDSARTSFIRS